MAYYTYLSYLKTITFTIRSVVLHLLSCECVYKTLVKLQAELIRNTRKYTYKTKDLSHKFAC